MQMSLFSGTSLRLASDGTPLPLDEPRFGTTKGPWTAEVEGFDIHAGVTVRAGARDGIERLLRYCARPPFSLERLSILSDGRVAYRLRKPRRNGATHLVLEPIAFLARIASIIVPPRYPLVRLAGVFAPHSSWRSAVVPNAPPPRSKTAPSTAGKTKQNKTRDASPILASKGVSSSGPGRTSAQATSNAPRTSLGAGIAKPVGARIDWARLIRHIYLDDVLACPCGARRRVLAHIEHPDVIAAILEHLGLPIDPPPIARARSPGAASI